MTERYVLFLTGAPGAGKSETLTHLHDILWARGVGSAAIDVDELARTYPATDAARHRKHLSLIAESFRNAGHEVLLVAATAESDQDLHAWLSAGGAVRRCIVHLIAEPATLEERIRDREPPGWIGLPDLVESARRLAAIRFTDTDLEIDTGTHGPDEVAAAVAAELWTRLDASAP